MNERKKLKSLSLKRKVNKTKSDEDNNHNEDRDVTLSELKHDQFENGSTKFCRTEEKSNLTEIKQFIRRWKDPNWRELRNLPCYEEAVQTSNSHDINLKTVEVHNLSDLPEIDTKS